MVDDHEDTSRAMSRLLGGLGYDVRTAGTVEGALAAAEEQAFDVLISDIGLPDGSGLELMRKLCARDGRVKGIALSGFGMDEDVRRSREAGFREHLTKPINLQKLQQAIEKLTVEIE
jgi:CheY-like chemotaxis protein